MVSWRSDHLRDNIRCRVVVDKGEKPWDGWYEQEFGASEEEVKSGSMYIHLDPRFYRTHTVQWGVQCGGSLSEVRTLFVK